MGENITKLILTRHGETVANRNNIFRGRQDFPLNEVGIKQAQALAEHLYQRTKQIGKISAIYSSPLSRALDTAKPVAEKFGIEVIVDERFTNISLGEWEGVPHSEIAEKFPEKYHLWRTEPEKLVIPGGEKLADVQRRSVEGVMRIIERHPGETVAIVTHRAVLKPLIAGLIDIPAPYFWKIHIDNAAYSVVWHNPGRGFMIYQSNVNHYLPDFVIEM